MERYVILYVVILGCLYNQAYALNDTQPGNQTSTTKLSLKPKDGPKKRTNPVITHPCRIKPADYEQVQYLEDSMMYIFEIEMYNKSADPLRSDISKTYKPWKWYRTASEHGKTLLTLSFNYDVLSLTILTIGVKRVNLTVKDWPPGCFSELTAEERVVMIRDKVFDNFRSKKAKKKVDDEGIAILDDSRPQVIYVCNTVVRNDNGYAEFANRCCAKDSDGKYTCSEQEDNLWITVLYICIGLVKLMLFMFAPLLVPSYMYTASYVASEYVVKLTHELKMKVFVSESTSTSMRFKHRLTINDIADWRRFRESLEELPMDEVCDVKVPELRIKVKGKRTIPANEPPTGLLRTFYDNLVRCKIRSLDPFKDCCNRSIYASLQPLIKHKCTWEHVVLIFMKLVTLLLVPFPFYLRTFIYYRFEEAEMFIRRAFVNDLGLKLAFNPFRMNIVQYLTPTHSLFIAVYSVYILAGLVVGFTEDSVRDKLQSIVRSAFSDMQNVSRTNVLQVLLGFLLWPFRKLGLLALLSCPIISILTAPVWCSIFVLYCIPTVYLSYRLIFHSRKKLGNGNNLFDSDKPMGKAKQKAFRLQKKMAKIDKGVHVTRTTYSAEEKHSPCMYGYGRLFAIRRLVLQFIVSLFCLTVLFAAILLFVEAAGAMVEVMAFTLMGIIVNAGSTLRYVSMALLVIVYMHSCYDNVYDNYLTFNGVLIDEVMDRVDDLKKIASLPSSMQENAAFQVKPVEAVDEIPTSLNLEKHEPQWRIGHLLMFLDSFDTPRIPLNLFKKMCEVRVHGAPGPVYINLLKATGKFSIIVVFLFFVMIVVMAFGSNNQMSSTNQTLATLAGGFVPMLLKNVLSSKGVKLNLKTLSFKGQIDEIIAEFKQNWPIYDFIIERYDPNAEVADKEKDGDDDDGTKNGKTDGNKNDKKDKIENESKDSDNRADKESINDNGKPPPYGSAMTSLFVPNPFNDSTEDLRPTGIVKGPQWFRRLSIAPPDDNYCDLFIDLSVAESNEPWNWLHGSSETINDGQSVTMANDYSMEDIDTRMPYQTNANNVHNYNMEQV